MYDTIFGSCPKFNNDHTNLVPIGQFSYGSCCFSGRVRNSYPYLGVQLTIIELKNCN
ncbi:hypothetical protein Hanom_Chr11g01061571 [Helianthus anomalus]